MHEIAHNLTQIFDQSIKKNTSHCVKKNFELVNQLHALSNIKFIKTYNSGIYFNNINLTILTILLHN